ncbi:hypothetical protein Tco_1411880 [Tanacetum coccineum]
MKAIRQVLRYVKGTKDYGITYKHNGGNKIHGFSDSSYGVNTQEGKGTTGIIFYYGESPISWSTQKQATVALSSCESEFIAATAAATQALWLKRLLSKLTHSQEEKVTIQVDNKSAIALMKNPVFHGRSKHIDTKYHFIRECVEREDIQVEFKSVEYQKADILTKALPKIKFLTMRQLIGLKDLRHSIFDPTRASKYCGGHPLALKVLDSFLLNEDADTWSRTFTMLEEESEVTEAILKDCGLRTSYGIKKLVERCLLTIRVGGELKMHQLLQGIGRDLVHQESPHKPWKRSRGTTKIQGIFFDMKMLKKEPLCGSSSAIDQEFKDKDLNMNFGAAPSSSRLLEFSSSCCRKIEFSTNALKKMDKLILL